MSIACLSVRQPWASLIATGIKQVENRAWRCFYKGPLLIHAGKTWGDDEQGSYNEIMQNAIDRGDARMQDILAASRSYRGGFVGVVRMVACIHEDDWYRQGGRPYDGYSEWFVGPYGYQFIHARHFPRLVAFKGRQGLFRVPERVVPYDLAV